MKKERSDYLFQQYLDKKCSVEEKTELMELLNKNGSPVSIEALMDKLWDEPSEAELEVDEAEAILARVMKSDQPLENPKPSRVLKLWWGWAAAVLVVAVAGLLMLNRSGNTPSLALNNNNKTESPGKVVDIETAITESTLDEHKKVTLPDGSTVILNNNSSITYSRKFQADKREVSLTGEGYFDIKHDDHKSFIVHTGKVRTTVLGTAFNIKAYERDRSIAVTVTRGKVSVLNDEAVLGIITPNQQLIFNKDYKKSNFAKVVAKSVVRWQESDIFFDDVTMEQAAQELSKRFNTNITFHNERVKKCKFTATFLKGESLDEILKVICTYNNAQYQTNAGGITIKGEGCE